MTNSDVFKNSVFEKTDAFPMLILSLVAGVIFGILTDGFSITERYFGNNKIIRFITDFLSVVTTYFLLFIGAYNFNNGIIRAFSLVTACLSALIYKKRLSKSFLKLLNKLCDLAERFFKVAFSVVLYPVKRIYRFLVRIYRKTNRLYRTAKRKVAYKKELNKISSEAKRGFDLVLLPKEEKEWKTTERTKAKRSASPRR